MASQDLGCGLQSLAGESIGNYTSVMQSSIISANAFPLQIT